MSYRKYDSWMQDVLRSIVAYKLAEMSQVANEQKQESVYITFKTKHPGVIIPESILREYPDNMTIVLENNYWDLAAGIRHFEIGISLQGMPVKITVPYLSLMSFVDTKSAPIFSISFDMVLPSQIEKYGVWQPADLINDTKTHSQHNTTTTDMNNKDFLGLRIKESFLPQHIVDGLKKHQDQEKAPSILKKSTARIIPFIV